jgi:hypothetical protein
MVGKYDGRKPIGRPCCRWEENITMELKEIGSQTGLSQIRLEAGGWLL